jgi:hypothetical protein
MKITRIWRTRAPVAFLALFSGYDNVAFGDPSPAVNNDWAVSIFGGVLTHDEFLRSLTLFDPRLGDSYIGGVDFSYAYYHFQKIPLDLEIDGSVAKRFGADHQWDLGVVPMARWKSFPWNDYVYTNFRLGLLGIDYVNGISPWELHWAGNDHGSHFLNYLALEVDFKPSESSPFEWYIGSHHRSGIFGLVNHTWGGSSYYTTGFRYHF